MAGEDFRISESPPIPRGMRVYSKTHIPTSQDNKNLYDCSFDLIIRVEDPNGIKLNEEIPEMAVELTEFIKEKYPHSVVLPRCFKMVEK